MLRHGWNTVMISILIASEGLACPPFIFVSQEPAQCSGQVAARVISRTCLCFLMIIPFLFLMLKMLYFFIWCLFVSTEARK